MKKWKWVKRIQRWRQKQQPWWETTHTKVCDFLREHPNESGAAVWRAVGGRHNRVFEVLYAGVDDGSLIVKAGTGNAKLYMLTPIVVEPPPVVEPPCEPVEPAGCLPPVALAPEPKLVIPEPVVVKPPVVETVTVQTPPADFMHDIASLNKPAIGCVLPEIETTLGAVPPAPPETSLDVIKHTVAEHAAHAMSPAPITVTPAVEIGTKSEPASSNSEPVAPAVKPLLWNNWSVPPAPEVPVPAPSGNVTAPSGNTPTPPVKIGDDRIFDEITRRPLMPHTPEQVQELLKYETMEQTLARIAVDKMRARAAQTKPVNVQAHIIRHRPTQT